MLNFIKERKLKFLLFGTFCIIAIFSWSIFVWQDVITKFIADLSVYFRSAVSMLNGVPLIFYSLAILILPLFFLPVTPVYFLASARTDEYSFVVVLFAWGYGKYFSFVFFGKKIWHIFAIASRPTQYKNSTNFAERRIRVDFFDENDSWESTFCSELWVGCSKRISF